ncbi:MAG: hypothetical protein AB1921_07020 [Thermodesulfobacteriota bacterium]
MKEVKRALLLIGGPRGLDGTSALLAEHLVEGFSRLSVATRREAVVNVVESEAQMEELLWGVDRADLVVLVSPVWMQGLTGPVTELFSEIVRRRGSVRSIRARAFAAVLYSRMPEAEACDAAMAICRQFARKADFSWRGGLRLPQSDVLDAAPWFQSIRASAVFAALRDSARCWTAGRPASGSAVRLMAKPLLPWPVYLVAQSVGLVREARKNGVRELLGHRPLGR